MVSQDDQFTLTVSSFSKNCCLNSIGMVYLWPRLLCCGCSFARSLVMLCAESARTATGKKQLYDFRRLFEGVWNLRDTFTGTWLVSYRGEVL